MNKHLIEVNVGDSVKVTEYLFGAMTAQYTGTVIKVAKTRFTVEHNGSISRFNFEGVKLGSCVSEYVWATK